MNNQAKLKLEKIKKLKLPEKVRATADKIEKGLSSADSATQKKAEDALNKLYDQIKAVAAKQREEKTEKEVNEKTIVPQNSDIAAPEAKKELTKKTTVADDVIDKALKNDPELAGFGRSDKRRDAGRKALPAGRRVARKGWANQFGKSDGGRVYYENRENRKDRKSPSYKSGYPYLAKGGKIHPMDDEDGTFYVNLYKTKGDQIMSVDEREYSSKASAMTYAMMKRDFMKEGESIFVMNDDGDVLYTSIGTRKMAMGGKFPYQNAQVGDSARVILDNKMGTIMVTYGRRFHLKFPDGTEKTYSAEELEFYPENDMMAKGGEIVNQYEGRTPEDIWNNLIKTQRLNFLFDHKNEIEMYRGKELRLTEIVDASDSDWDGLDEMLKYRFESHTERGQYAVGGMMAKGGYMAEGENYEYVNTFKRFDSNVPVPDEDFEKLVDAYHKQLSGDKLAVSKYKVLKLQMGNYLGHKTVEEMEAYIEKTHNAHKMADGGYMAKGSYLENDAYSSKKELNQDFKRIIQSPKSKNIYEQSDESLVGKFVTIKLPNEINSFKTKVSREYANMVVGSGKHNGVFSKEYIIKKELGGYMADGGAIKGSNPSTGEKFGVVIGSLEKEDGLTTFTIRSSYSARINSYELTFDEKGFLRSIGDLGYTIDGTYPDMKRGYVSVKNVNADNKKESIDALAKITSPSFAKKVYDYVQEEKMSKGGITNKLDYIPRRQIKLIIIKNPNKKGTRNYLQIDKKDFLDGLYLEKGGKIDKALYTYIPRTSINQVVTIKNQIYSNPKNGFWVSNEALNKAGKNLEKTFKKDDVVYNKETNTIGIVRSDSYGDGTTNTDSDGVVSTSLLEKFNTITHFSASIANSTMKEIRDRNLVPEEDMKRRNAPSKSLFNKTYLRKSKVLGWTADTYTDGKHYGFDWKISTYKRGDYLTSIAQAGKDENGIWSFMLYQDPSIVLIREYNKRSTEKSVGEQQEKALKMFEEKLDDGTIKSKVDSKMAKGGKIGFEALSKKVASRYVGKNVKPKFQGEYGKTYDKAEAKEVGDKVAAKVYRMQQGKMAMGGKIELPYELDKYFTKPAGTIEVEMTKLIPIRARKEGIENAEVYMKKAYDGKMSKRKPIEIYKTRNKKYRVNDGNSTYAVAKKNGWETIYATVVSNPNVSKRAEKSTFAIAKEIRKEGEKWSDAVKRVKENRK